MPRLFTAIRLPPAIMDSLLDTMEALEHARWQDDEQLHLTLTFLDAVPPTQVDDLIASLSRVAFDRFDLEVKGVDHFEHKGRVNAVWAGITPCPALIALQARVAQACASAGVVPDHRRYLPHITLARMNRGGADLPAWLARHALLLLPPFTVSRFALFESTLGHGGAIYTALAEFPCR
jgi:2'-5' RNA ligase